jgi:hypothetical protein
MNTYVESFDGGPGGWLGWTSNAAGPHRLDIRQSCAIERGPWWIDYNHAPPGGGYLHLPYSLLTRPHHSEPDLYAQLSDANRFIEGGFPLNFTDAKVTLRLRGIVDLRGANLVFHIQSKRGPVFVNHCMTGRPFSITREWSEETVELTADPSLWTALGSRHDRTNFYGDAPVADSLADVNSNILLVLFPLNVVPVGLVSDPHRLRAGEDYVVDRSRLPEGIIQLDEVRIEFRRS